MDWQDIFKLLHVLTFVYWVGADLGVFYAARLVVNPKYSPETRATLLKTLAWIDMIPRYMLLLTFPVGATLAANLGISPIDGVWLYLVWIAAAAWIVMAWQIHHREGTDAARRLTKFDLVLRLAFLAALVIPAITSLAGAGPYETQWLPIKILLFAGAVACGVGIRVTFTPFGAAFGKLMTEGSSPAVETQMSRSLAHAVPFVIGIWVFAAITAFLGMNHEMLFGS
ncbi:MAG: hypothetical protein O3C65_05030 [Proteobacteria bacterium]|nr:hypothetical protein [Pseudomonadota bacterium]MDA1058032.1 hypothetical protein [Pseudomonadota bacterium]